MEVIMNKERLVKDYQSGNITEDQLFDLVKCLNDTIKIIQRVHMLSNVCNDKHKPQSREMITINNITSNFVYKYEQIISCF